MQKFELKQWRLCKGKSQLELLQNADGLSVDFQAREQQGGKVK